MKKIILSLIAIMLFMSNVEAKRIYANFGIPATNGTWDAETGTYTWHGSTNNLTQIFSFDKGTFDCTHMHINFSTIDIDTYDGNNFRVVFQSENNTVATIVFSSTGDKDIEFSTNTSTKNVDLSQVTSILVGGSNSENGRIHIDASTLYLKCPTKLVWGNDGKAHFSIYDFEPSQNVDIDYQNGQITSKSTSNSYVSITLDKAYDLSTLTRWQMGISDDNIFNSWNLVGITKKADGENLGMYSGWNDRRFGQGYTVNSDDYDMENVTAIKFNFNKTGSATISNPVLTAKVATAEPDMEVAINKAPWYHRQDSQSGYEQVNSGFSYIINESTGVAFYGCNYNGENGNNYADLSAYKAIRVYQDDNTYGPRAFFLNNENNKHVQINNSYVKWVTDGYYEIDLSGAQTKRLTTLRPASGQNYSVNAITIIANNSYTLYGSAMKQESFIAALADASATSYDATGLTDAIELAPANNNAVIYASTGTAATSSVGILIKGSNADEATFTEGFDVNIPAAFTATTASYTRNLPASGYATMVLPFACEMPDGVYAYNAVYENEELVCTKYGTAVPANTPFIAYKNGGGETTFSASTGSIPATPGEIKEECLVGTYTRQQVPAGSYVISSGKLMSVTAGNEPTIGQFRAYLTIPGAGAGELRMKFVEEEGISTGISNISENDCKEVIFDMKGRRVSEMKRGNIYIRNNKKIIF